MSAFHASRNADIAKKPYNPILGETFRCYWNVPGYPKSEVSFLSHHPIIANSDSMCPVGESAVSLMKFSVKDSLSLTVLAKANVVIIFAKKIMRRFGTANAPPGFAQMLKSPGK